MIELPHTRRRSGPPQPWQAGVPPAVAAALPSDEALAGIYVHIPFCAAICSFCAFEAVASRGDRHARYVAAVSREATEAAARLGRRTFDSIHFGGGTPSLLEPEQLGEILQTLQREFVIAKGAEVAIEADPATVDRGRLERLRAAGFNRVHFGAQSFDAAELKLLGRAHEPGEGVRAVSDAFAAGFVNVGVDLIFGLPDQSESAWERNLNVAIDLGVVHLSCYGLSIEEGSVFHAREKKGAMALPPEDDSRRHLEIAMDRLGAAGFLQYEISNYARPGFPSRHNLKYWCGAPYLALGSAAHGYLDGVRYAHRPDPEGYMKSIEQGRSVRVHEARVTALEAREEAVFLHLRKVTGLSLSHFQALHGMSVADAFAPGLERLSGLDLLVQSGDRWCLTRAGVLVSDSVFDVLLSNI